jgi:hypothetical protein
MAQAASRCSLALVAALVGSLPGQARANDRDLRVPPVPAASCTAEGGGGGKWTHGAFVLGGRLPPEPGDLRPSIQWLRCPLPVDNAAVLDRSPDDRDIASFQVLYHDADGPGADTYVQIALYQTTLLPSGTLQSRPVCLWNSNTGGSGATGHAQAAAACAHDIAAAAFYHFEVQLRTYAVGPDRIFAEFVGITFPQR